MDKFIEFTLADEDSESAKPVYIQFSRVAAFHETKKTVMFDYLNYNGSDIILMSGKVIRVQEELAEIRSKLEQY